MKKPAGSLLLILCVYLLSSCELQPSSSTPSTTCRLNLEVVVRQGTSANYVVSGQVMFGTSTWSDFDGELVAESGSAHPISMYFDGPATHFILDTEKGRMYGTGVMESGLAACAGDGGGTLSGPAPGDLGEWRGEWIRETGAFAQEQPRRDPLSSLLCIGIPAAILVVILVIGLVRLFAPFKKNPSNKSGAALSALQRTAQGAEREPGEDRAPLAEYLVTYTAGDKLFDLSFEIAESANYLGECGITVARALEDASGQATALEIWLFDARSAQTVSGILMSDYCYRQIPLRNEMEEKGRAILIRPEGTIVLETRELRASARVDHVEYEPESPNPNSAFKRVTIKIGVWKHP